MEFNGLKYWMLLVLGPPGLRCACVCEIIIAVAESLDGCRRRRRTVIRRYPWFFSGGFDAEKTNTMRSLSLLGSLPVGRVPGLHF